MLRRSYRTVDSLWTVNSSGRLDSRKTVPSPRPEAAPRGSMILRGCGRYPVMEFRPVGSRCAALPSPSSANPCSPRTSIGAKTGSSRSGCTRNAASWPCPRYGRTCAGSMTVRASGERAPAAQESRAGNCVAARSTDRHREIHSSGPTHGGSGECAGGLPMGHLIGVGTARSGTGLNDVDQRRITGWPSNRWV